ncbi:MetQ/NlpA family ABC transporter substrate-binding protein [Thiotrichales bacterium 19S9-12]|nr:MetQ/NlpA family ABC transporter substrate-binding protein [Thiotrichales bacterium 19S9-11]MCF6810762.1 MetQ/NlpA family ABC transporter substrate-binding protein [Thiotrichales bacterium 19S9-12]
MQQLMLSEVILSTWQTIYMVFLSSVVSILLGLILGVLLYLSAKSKSIKARLFNATLGVIVNATRSVPYIILMILLIPLTVFIIGTSIGTNASIISLTVAAIPFYARLAESAINKVDYGLIEAAESMGSTRLQIIFKVLLPEAKTQLITGATLTVISLISYSAMAGAVGGGGLGTLAIQYGYQRFNLTVMLETVIILILIVQMAQSFGDHLAKLKSLNKLYAITFILAIGSIAQIIYTNLPQRDTALSIGYSSGPMTIVMEAAQQVAKNDFGINLKPIAFDDYNLPNRALASGDIDANAFQHIPFLEAEIKNHDYKIQALAKTFIFPMGLYSTKIHSITDLPIGAHVVIPNDPTNQGRALMLLEKAGVIKLKPNTNWKSTTSDIASNPLKLKITTLDAAQITRILNQVDLAAINNDFIAQANLSLKDAVFVEPKSSPFANIIAIRNRDKNNPVFKKLVEIMHSQAVIQAANKAFPNDAAIPAWQIKSTK